MCSLRSLEVITTERHQDDQGYFNLEIVRTRRECMNRVLSNLHENMKRMNKTYQTLLVHTYYILTCYRNFLLWYLN